jgi:hypothetical protein
MRLSYRLRLAAAQLMALCLLHIAATQAGNNSFISDAPMGKFNDEDLRLMNANIDAALTDAKIRVVHSWSNLATKNSGTAETLQILVGPNGIPCKRIRVANSAGNLKGSGQYTLCKMEGKGWTFVPKDYAVSQPANPQPANSSQ